MQFSSTLFIFCQGVSKELRPLGCAICPSEAPSFDNRVSLNQLLSQSTCFSVNGVRLALGSGKFTTYLFGFLTDTFSATRSSEAALKAPVGFRGMQNCLHHFPDWGCNKLLPMKIHATINVAFSCADFVMFQSRHPCINKTSCMQGTQASFKKICIPHLQHYCLAVHLCVGKKSGL